MTETKSKPLLVNTRDSATMCGVATKTWRTWAVLGITPKPVKIGRNLFWRHDEILAWIEAGCPRR